MAPDAPIEMPVLLWRRLVQQLARRSAQRRESGAFLLGKLNGVRPTIVEFICYDDLDPRALSHGIVEFHRTGFSSLWHVCKAKGLRVLADAHTHPDGDVRQSGVDRAHPMLPVAGHVALILPHFGRTSAWSLSGTGIHRFLGQRQWQSHEAGAADAPIRLSLW